MNEQWRSLSDRILDYAADKAKEHIQEVILDHLFPELIKVATGALDALSKIASFSEAAQLAAAGDDPSRPAVTFKQLSQVWERLVNTIPPLQDRG